MSGQENEDVGFLNCPSSGMSKNPMPEKVSGLMAMSSLSMFKPSGGSSDPFFGSDWDPICSLGGQSENFGGSSSMVSQGDFCNPHYNPSVMESQGMSSTISHMVQYPSDSSFVEMAPKLSCFGSSGFSDMVSPFGFPPIGQSLDACQVSDAALGSLSPNGKRRKRAPDSDSPLSCNKSVEGEQKKELSSAEISDVVGKEQDERKPKVEENTSGNVRGKQSGKQAKDGSIGDEAPKENYIHVRARRGQATNSHSLAERVRREKISERMRLLQELVPGCSKITGKAVMLDEIINYVQSLQQQVEFLSMKLATVNPELNIDIERLISKDILNTRGSAGAIFGLSHGISSSQHFPHGMFQGTMPNLPTTSPHFASLSQGVLENELHNLYNMGFESNSVVDNLGPNGRLKPEV